MRFLALVLSMSVAAGPAARESGGDAPDYFPQQLKANRLLYYCAGSSLTGTGRERLKTCAGFISGVEEGVRLLEARGLLTEPSGICVPKGASSSMFAQAYRRHAAKGADNDKPAAEVVIEALRKAYPC